mmetsp:Transcript_23153/g.54662  ORF Transcript_23153/g.54662 Transcript_23153/m.54662 type:complete len:511 (-) Transcript_23153:499-2031(-)
MTVVRRSTMKNARNRYRGTNSKRNRSCSLLVVNVLFLISFTVYQIILSKSNGGREAMSSTYQTFLKGRKESRKDTDEGFSDSAAEVIAYEGHQEIEPQREVRVPQITREENPSLKEDEVNVNGIPADVLLNTKDYDTFSKENEVDFEEDVADVPKFAKEHNPFSKENEVNLDDDAAELQSLVRERDPFSKQNEATAEDQPSNILETADEHDPLSKPREVQSEDNLVVANGREKHDFLDDNSSGSLYVFDPDHQIFHNYYKGKSGKVVREMLMAHAYIFHQNATYGGCCGSQSAKISAHEDLLDSLGLNGPLRFRCPRDFVQDTRTRRSVIPRDAYSAEDTRIWTPDYVDYLRSLVTYPEKRYKGYTIVVHMLRGNTSPCKEKSHGYHSYLPNLHYLKLIETYMQPGARVIIYTSSKSFEDLNEFRNRGYEVNTGTSLKDTWKDYITADIFIMSRSDFSLVPAMVAKGIVVYTPFWHRSLRRWKRASKSIMRQTDQELERLQETKCIFPIG